MKNEIIIYAQNELAERIEVRMEQETFWLTQLQISNLFERDRTVITKHLKNIFLEKELDEKVVCAFFAHTTQHGAMLGKTQQKNSKYYNLDDQFINNRIACDNLVRICLRSMMKSKNPCSSKNSAF
jgi:hypothetical protein